eukprot:s467_g21.t1
MPRLAKRRKLAIVVIATALITFTGLKARSAEISAKQYEDAVRDCTFCVSIADPRREDCPLIAVSDEFLTMTGYLREEVVGKNCRFLNRNCYLEPSTFKGLRQACNTGDAFTGVLLNRRKSGDLFMNFVNLQGLVIAKNPRGDPLWFVIGIQADVTHVCLEKAPEQLPRLHEDSRAFSRQKTIIDTVIESNHTEADDCDVLNAAQGQPGMKSTSARLSSFARQQSQQVDSLVPSAIHTGDLDEVMQTAIRDCNFCVSIADPRATDCPLVAVSDQFEVLTGYAREDACSGSCKGCVRYNGDTIEEIIGKNCRFLNQNCPLGEGDQRALREACLNGSPFCKVIVNRRTDRCRKSGDLFLNFLDLRGVTVARNIKTREELWFLVGIQADDHLKKIQDVASSIRARIADQLSLMALAGSFAAGCLSNAGEEVLWVPVSSPHWIQGEKAQAGPWVCTSWSDSNGTKLQASGPLHWYLEQAMSSQASPNKQSSTQRQAAELAMELGGFSGFLSSTIWVLPHLLESLLRWRERFSGDLALIGYNIHSISRNEDWPESLRKAQDTVKMGKTLEEEGVKVQEEERETIGREQIELDMKLEKKEAVLEERVRRTERLLQQEEKELDDELPAIEREAAGEKVKQIKNERQEVEAERERLRMEELEIRQSERRIDEEVRRLRRDRALRVFNVLPAFKVLLGPRGA